MCNYYMYTSGETALMLLVDSYRKQTHNKTFEYLLTHGASVTHGTWGNM